MARKKEIIAMILTPNRKNRLGVLTERMPKEAVMFGGKYRVIDFTLSNCINSDIDTIGVVAQYLPLKLSRHIGTGTPWDLDSNDGGVSILSPYEDRENRAFFKGTADAVYQNLSYIDEFDPEYLLVLRGDHIYKMDYRLMLRDHKKNGADVTIAAKPVSKEETFRHHIAVTEKDNNRVTAYQNFPEESKGKFASIGVFIFTWKKLREFLVKNSETDKFDFEKHVIPAYVQNGASAYVYPFDNYWKDLRTLKDYWETNMELLDPVPELNLYEEFRKVYTKSETTAPVFVGDAGPLEKSIFGNNCNIQGEVRNSVLGSNVTVSPGASVEDSVIMSGTFVGADTHIRKTIIAEECKIGSGAEIGIGEYRKSDYDQDIYNSSLSVIGAYSEIPDNVTIGRNVVISGKTVSEDYEDNCIKSGEYLIKTEEEK